MQRLPLAVAATAYAAAVFLANWLSTHYGMAEVGFGLTASAGTFAAGFALLARDFVQRLGGPWVAVAAVAVGAVASYLLADHFIALASAAAFLTAELLDLALFTRLFGRLGFARASFLSNLVAAPVDSLIFLALAPAPIFVVTSDAMLGQTVGKIVWATMIPLCLWMLATRPHPYGLLHQGGIEAACDWSDYRADYGVSPANIRAAHKAFLAGRRARRYGDQSTALR